MKTKKILFLSTLLMVFSFTAIFAQQGEPDGTCGAITTYHRINNSGGWNEVTPVSDATDITLEAGDSFIAGINPKPDGSTLVITVDGNPEYSGPTGDHSIVNPVPTSGDTATVVVVYADGCGTYTHTWNLTAVDCVPTTIIPYYYLTGWVNDTTIAMGESQTLVFGNSDLGTGVWAWSSTTAGITFSDPAVRDPTVTGGLTPGVHTITSTFTDDCDTSTLDFTVTVTAGCAPSTPVINPYYFITGWVNDTTIAMGETQTLVFGNSDIGAGTWAWTSTTAGITFSDPAIRDPEVTGGLTPGVHSITSTFTEPCNINSDSVTFTVTVASGCTSTSTPTLYYNDNIDDNGPEWVDPATIDAGNIITIDPIPTSGTVWLGAKNLAGGSVTWTDNQDTGFTSMDGQFEYTPGFTDGDQQRIVTASYRDICENLTEYFYHISSTSECVAASSTLYYNDNNGSGWMDLAPIEAGNIITIAPIPYSGKVVVGFHSDGRTVTWTDDKGTGFTSTDSQFTYDPDFTDGGQTRILTATYTVDACGNETVYTFNISSTSECSPRTIEPYYNDHVGSGWVYKETTDYVFDIAMQIDETIEVGINPSINEDDGETLTWAGCNGFTGTEKQFYFDPEFEEVDDTCDLVATFTDACGTRTYTYRLTAATGCISSIPNPYYSINNESEIEGLTTDNDISFEVPPLGLIELGIEPGVGGHNGSIVWTDSLDNTLGTGEQLSFGISEAFEDDMVITGVYTDKCGVSTTYTFNLTLACSPPVFTYNDNNGSDLVDPATIDIDNNITIAPIPYSGTVQVGIKDLNGGSVVWSNGSTDVEFTYDPEFTDGGQEHTLTASYTDFCGDTTDYSYKMSSTSVCIVSNPTFYYNTGGDDSSGVNLGDGPITIDPIQIGATVTIKVDLNRGTIEWSDNNNTTPFSGTDSEFIYNPGFTVGNQERLLTGVYKNFCDDNTTSFVYNLSALDECVPNTPIITSPQIVCRFDRFVDLEEEVTVDAGANLLWYADEIGGTPINSTAFLVPGNYYVAAVNTDEACESSANESARELVVIATNNALYFDGQNDFVTLDTNPIQNGAKTFTIEAWIKPDASNYDGFYHAIFGSVQEGGNNTRSPSFYISNANSSGGLHFDSYSALTLDRFQIETPATDTPLIAENKWSHIAVVNDGTMYSLYVNGELIITADAPPQGVNITEGTTYAFGLVDNNFAGLIDEARFWDVARSASEISDNMNQDLVGDEPGLVSYYTFNQGIANGDNTAMDNLDPPSPLYDSTAGQNTGFIRNFALSGTASNFVGGYFAQITGPSSETIIGGTIQLAHTTPDGYWLSDSEEIITVNDETGLVTGVSVGTTEISYTFCGVSTKYEITVIPNAGPTMSPIENQETCPGASIADLSFVIADDDTPLNLLVLEATSSNTDLIPNDQIVLGGTDENRTVALSPVSDASGTVTISIKATDSDDMFSTMSFDVTFADTTKPTAIAEDFVAELDANGEVTITADQINNNSTDDCTDASALILEVSPSSFNCANIGENTVTLTVTDAIGNFETSTATVTITDVTGPTVNTQDISVVLDATDAATITADQINNGSADSCTNASDLILSVSPSSFTCADVGENTVTLTVTDAYGNENTETAIVTITETTAPTIISKPLTVTLGDNGYVSITADELDNGSSDSCGDVSFTASQLDFSCNDIGENTVELTVTDSSGNTSSVSEIVTVVGEASSCGIKVSEAITANGDGVNDTWMIYNIEEHPNTSVRVFNRWGAQVYYSIDYKNDWNGRYYKGSKNELPSSGSYFYQVDVDGDGTIDNQGWLYITK